MNSKDNLLTRIDGLPRRIAIAHDALVVAGGAERLTAILSQTFPDADIYTSAYLPEKTYPYFKTKKIHTLVG